MNGCKMQMVFIFWFVIQVSCSSNINNSYLLDASITINGKKAFNKNHTLNDASFFKNIQPISLNISSSNYKNNITLTINVYANISNQWKIKQSRTIKITDLQPPFNNINYFAQTLLKFKNRNYQKKIIEAKTQCLFSSIQIVLSQSNGQLPFNLEDSALFTKINDCVPINLLDQKSTPFNISFTYIIKETFFSANLQKLERLNALQHSMRDLKLRYPYHNLPQETVKQPKYFYKFIQSNVLMFNGKAYKKAGDDKAIEALKQGYYYFLFKNIHKISWQNNHQYLQSKMDKFLNPYNISTDSSVPSFQIYYLQSFLLQKIQRIRQFIKQYANMKEYDVVTIVEKWVYYDYYASFALGFFWIIIDFLTYATIKTSVGTSCSFRAFLSVWLFLEGFILIIRIGISNNPLYLLVVFIFYGLYAIINTKILCKYKRYPHQYIELDHNLTRMILGLLQTIIFLNAVFHKYLVQDLTTANLFFYSIPQYIYLFREYYYFLVMIPQLLLNYKLKTVKHMSLTRIFLFIIIALKDNYLILIDSHPLLIAFRLKQQFLVIIFIYQCLRYGGIGRGTKPDQYPEIVEKKQIKAQKKIDSTNIPEISHQDTQERQEQ